ncbi:hypothetical protein EPA93_35875 [Ktedonosporobacter rubrisoli]|uniref:Uncharacterized protein n=1 Tax=Ktedonosporobacter rubrisoli TaxID=2509675 RepID=A0A4P6JZA8_KTERU|nr:hypothetical protein [Ktedonosporobacter rubrisoli]QBD81064.1 hypothetical protein EPA93_35875 [Ktedonosporobacter rubrisoli]
MASDRKDPGAIWQGSTHAHQDQSLTQKQLHDEDELPALPDQQQARARQGDLSSSQEEDAFPAPEELAEELDPRLLHSGKLSHRTSYFYSFH